MSEQQRPITPPPELVQQWASLSPLQHSDETWAYELFIAHQASRWAAGQQLEQDAKWLDANAVFSPNLTISPSGDALRQAMRPKSPSLKELALSALKAINLREDDPLLYQEILNAVEGLPYDRLPIDKTMTDQQHPITPPPELVEQWVQNTRSHDSIGAFPEDFNDQIATQAARWGADQELEACCAWLDEHLAYENNVTDNLRAARRPKPPSLKEQALTVLDDASDRLDAAHENIIRRALESLPS